MHSGVVLLIFAMGLVTYIPRMFPLVVFHRVQLPPFWQGVLKNVPYATLGALIVPGIFFIQDDKWFGMLGFISAFLAAWLGANVIVVVMVSVAVLSLYALM